MPLANCAYGPERPGSGPISLILALSGLLLCLRPARAVEVDGFTEPYRTVNISAPELGIITKIPVEEGEHVESGQVLATLDTDIHEVLLDIARQGMDAEGRLDSALAELKVREFRLEKLRELRRLGNARQEEVERAEADLAIAQSQVLAAREDRELKRLEHRKILAQIERRTIRSPLDGVVSRRLKEEGESATHNDSVIMTIVKLDPLYAVFSVESQWTSKLPPGHRVSIRFAGDSRATEGTVALVSPVTDAESGTVRIKVLVENPEGIYRSGERCILVLSSAAPESDPLH